MDETEHLTHEQKIFLHICENPHERLKRVDIVHGRINVRAAKDGELKLWEQEQMGGFRRFPLKLAEWEVSDTRRFNLLLRSPSTFFVLLHDDNAQFFPSRTALL